MARRFLSKSVWLLAAAFGLYFGLLVYCDINRPEAYGYRASFISGRLVVSAVAADADTPARRAGLLPGDVLLAADGQRLVRDSDWSNIEANIVFGRPIQLTVQRDRRVIERSLVLAATRWAYWRTAPGVVMVAVLAIQAVALAVAFVIVAKRRFDPAAVLGAWALGTAAVYMIAVPYRFAAVWRDLPTSVGALLWIPYVSGQAAAAVLCTFFLSFPRRTIQSRFVWVAIWGPMVVALLRPVGDAWLAIYGPAYIPRRAIASNPLTEVTGAYLIAGLAALVWNYRRLADLNERRRLSIVVIGAIAGLGPGLAVVVASRIRPDVTASIFTSRLTVVGTLSLLFPMSLAYAVLRHRVFGVPLIIRQGVRYAVARGMFSDDGGHFYAGGGFKVVIGR